MNKCGYIFSVLSLSVALVSSVDARPWVNTEGKTMEADFVKVEGSLVHLKKRNKVYKLEITSLSQKDQDYISELQEQLKLDEEAKIEAEENAERLKEESLRKLPINLDAKVSGKDLTSDELIGKPLVIHTWIAHCGVCPKHLAAFEKFAKRKKSTGATFMVWHYSDKLSLAKSKFDELGIRLPTYHGRGIRWDEEKFGKAPWPYVTLVSAQGEIVYMGSMNKEFEKLLKAQTDLN